MYNESDEEEGLKGEYVKIKKIYIGINRKKKIKKTTRICNKKRVKERVSVRKWRSRSGIYGLRGLHQERR